MDLSNLLQTFKDRSDGWMTTDNTNETSNSELDFIHRHRTLSLSYLATLCIATALGIVGNILVICAVILYKPLRTTGNMLIINLSLADLSVTALVDPFSIVGVVSGPKFFLQHIVLCHVVASFCLASCTSSMWSIAAIAINRYIAICKNVYYNKIFSRWKTLSLCVGIWIACFTLELPNLFGWGGHTFDLKTMACSYDRLANMSYTFFFCSLGIIIPLMIVSFCYIRILLYVKRSRAQLNGIAQSLAFRCGMERRQKNEFQLTKTLFIIFCVFLVSWTPYAVVILVDYQDQWSKVLYVVVIQLAHLNSSLNPLVYVLTNRKFKLGFQFILEIIFCCKRRVKQSIKSDNDCASVINTNTCFEMNNGLIQLKSKAIILSNCIHY